MAKRLAHTRQSHESTIYCAAARMGTGPWVRRELLGGRGENSGGEQGENRRGGVSVRGQGRAEAGVQGAGKG